MDSAGAQAGECQVQGCTHPVLQKVYYRRYRICPYHSALPCLVLEGTAVRWCQQCGRFHPLTEFSGDRRSCMRTLEMHNARRRRRQASVKLSKAAAAALGSRLPCKGGKAACMEDDSAAALPQSPFSSCALEELKQPPLKQPKAARSGSGGLHSTACSGDGGGGGGGTSGGSTGAAGSSADACPRGLVPVDLAHLASATSRYPSTGSNESELLALHGSTGLSHSAGGTPWDRLAEPGSNGTSCATHGDTLQQQPDITRGSSAGPPLVPSDSAAPGAGGQTSAGGSGAGDVATMVLDQLMSDRELQEMLAWLPGLDEGAGSEWRSTAAGAGGLASPLERPSDGPDLMVPEPPEAPQPMADAPEVLPGLGGSGQLLDALLPMPCQAATSGPWPGPAPGGCAPAWQSQQQQQPGALGGSPFFVGLCRSGAPSGVSCSASLAAAGAGAQWPAVAPTGDDSLLDSDSVAWLQQAAAFDGSDSVLGQQQQPQQQRRQLAPGGQQAALAGWPAARAVGLLDAVHASPMECEEDGQMLQLSLKLFNVTPGQLPELVRQDIMGLLATDPVFVDRFVRPGCTQFTAEAVLPAAEAERVQQAGAVGLAQEILQRAGWAERGGDGALWAADMLVQLGGQVAVVREGRLAAVVNAEAVAPRLIAARPLALLAGTAAAPVLGGGGGRCSGGLGEGTVTLWGYGISGSHDVVICRQAGRVLDLEVLARGTAPPPAGTPSGPRPDWVVVRPLGVQPGLLQFEVQRGGVLSAPASVTALPTQAAVMEALHAHTVLAGSPHRTHFLRNLGLVLSHKEELLRSASANRDGSGGGGGSSSSAASCRASAVALGLLLMARSYGWTQLAQLLSGVGAALHSGPSAAAAHPPTTIVPPPPVRPYQLATAGPAGGMAKATASSGSLRCLSVDGSSTPSRTSFEARRASPQQSGADSVSSSRSGSLARLSPGASGSAALLDDCLPSIRGSFGGGSPTARALCQAPGAAGQLPASPRGGPVGPGLQLAAAGDANSQVSRWPDESPGAEEREGALRGGTGAAARAAPPEDLLAVLREEAGGGERDAPGSGADGQEMPLPGKAGGFPAWVAMQLSGGGPPRRSAAGAPTGLPVRLYEPTALRLMLTAVAVVGGSLCMLRGAFGEA